VGDFEDFHRDFLPRFIEAQSAFHDGDADPNIALWTATDPVTLFAARGWCDSGTEHVTKTFRRVASEFSEVHDYKWELLASGVSGDLAYTVAIERYMASTHGGPQALGQLRVTHVFRRERTVAGGAPPCRPQAARPTARHVTYSTRTRSALPCVGSPTSLVPASSPASPDRRPSDAVRRHTRRPKPNPRHDPGRRRPLPRTPT
jgi:ketosteroid isomerase-like protein